MVVYSHSRLSTFEQCKLKFKFQYIDKLTPEIKETIEGFLGHKVHETLEFVYKQVLQKQTPNLDKIIDYYINSWNNDFNNKIKIVKQELGAEYYFNQGIKFLIDYFLKYSPFDDNTIATEKKILINLDNEKKYQMQGYVDRIVHNLDSNIYEIHDYKTSSFLKSQEELDKDRQLAIYSLGIRELFENVQDVHLIWHFLAFNKKIISTRTNEQLEQLKQEIINLINKIEQETEFNANPGKLCNWCEFQNHCKEFNNLQNNPG
jgi:putative RecB family exonuclease